MTASIDVKRLANDKGDLFVCSFTQKGTRSHVSGKAAPEMKAASRMIDAHATGPVQLNCL